MATFALAARFPAHPLGILMGTTLGMLVADAFGIGFGVLLCKRIPEETIKLISAIVFFLFGFYGVFQVSRDMFSLSMPAAVAILIVLALITGVSVKIVRASSLKVEKNMECLRKVEG